MNPILEVNSLTKIYGDKTAVDNLSFQINPGICFGLLGPNGAGKTTTIEMIEGITPPTSGEIRYKGSLRTDRFKHEIGIQFQSTSLMDFLSVQEVLALFSRLYPITVPQDTLISKCHLTDILHQPAAKLSGGQRQRLLLAIALINDPKIIFLDEPTTGLDPQSRRNFWQLIKDIKAEGKTVVLTTHYMDEAEQLCDYLIIVDSGKIIAEGSPQTLLNNHFGYAYICLDKQDVPPTLPLESELESTGTQTIIKSQAVEATLEELIKLKVNLSSLQVRNPTLDDLFLKLTGHSLRE